MMKGVNYLIIKKKLDAIRLLEEFNDVASYDYENEKRYFVFKDKERGGQYTLMNMNGRWSIHGKGEDYCDVGETMMDDLDGLLEFVWKHRSKINQALKVLQDSTVTA